MYIQITFYKNILSGVFNLAYKEEKANVSCTNVFHVINKLLRGLLITVSKFIINSQIQEKGYSCDF